MANTEATGKQVPTNTRRWPNVGLLLGQGRERWANSKPTMGQRLIIARYARASTST